MSEGLSIRNTLYTGGLLSRGAYFREGAYYPDYTVSFPSESVVCLIVLNMPLSAPINVSVVKQLSGDIAKLFTGMNKLQVSNRLKKTFSGKDSN